MVNFPALIRGCDSHSLVLLGLCISFDASICSKMAFSALRNSDHVVVSVSSDFQSNLKGMFHGRISLNFLLLLLLLNFESGFRLQLMYISFIVNTVSMVLSCLCCQHSSQQSLFCLSGPLERGIGEGRVGIGSSPPHPPPDTPHQKKSFLSIFDFFLKSP